MAELSRGPVDFSFLLHPLSREDVYRKFAFMSKWPSSVVEGIMRVIPPIFTSRITGIKSPHRSVEGSFYSIPLTTRKMLELPAKVTVGKIIAAGKKAARDGAKIIGLGAMTAVVGDGGITAARHLDIAVTTGNSYTVATALEGTEKAAELMGLDFTKADVAILGATGSVGSACARIMARKVRSLTLIARDIRRLEKLAEKILAETGLTPDVTSDIKSAIRKADIIVAVSSSAETLVEAEDLKPGAIVCDVARPRDVSVSVKEKRDDVLIIEGGVVEVPGNVNFNFNFGFPPGMAYACMAETMILALEQRYENFSLGKEMSVEQIDEIRSLAVKHGFKLAGFRSFERALSTEDIMQIKERAREKQGLGIRD